MCFLLMCVTEEWGRHSDERQETTKLKLCMIQVGCEGVMAVNYEKGNHRWL